MHILLRFCILRCRIYAEVKSMIKNANKTGFRSNTASKPGPYVNHDVRGVNIPSKPIGKPGTKPGAKPGKNTGR